MFYLAAGWHYPSLGLLMGARPLARPFFSCLLSCTQAGLASFGAHFPSCALQAMACPDDCLDEKQAKPLIASASLVDTVFPPFDCI